MKNPAAASAVPVAGGNGPRKQTYLRRVVNGTSVSYKTSGDGPPLVFFHGWIGNEDTFDLCHDDFARHYTVYCPAWPGYGYSPPIEEMTIADLVELSRSFILGLGHERVILFGNCLGGNVAMELVRRYPAMVERLVLIEVYDFMPWYLRPILIPGLNRFLYRLLLRSMAGFRFLNGLLQIQTGGGGRGARYAEEGFRRTSEHSAVAFMKAIHRFSKQWRDFYRSHYRCEVPVVYVEGGRSFAPVEAFRRVVGTYYKNLVVVSIPESLHNPVVEHPELFTARVLPELRPVAA